MLGEIGRRLVERLARRQAAIEGLRRTFLERLREFGCLIPGSEEKVERLDLEALLYGDASQVRKEMFDLLYPPELPERQGQREGSWR
jgi:hypothetical protein